MLNCRECGARPFTFTPHPIGGKELYVEKMGGRAARLRIGRGAIIGARTIVTSDVPAFSVVVGNPMRIVRTLEDEQ